MAQDITIAGVQYPDVPAIQVPKTGSGTATFTDVSDTTATAADVSAGTYFYTAQGVRTEGTGSGGGGTSYMETLWSNNSPASTFAEQTITLSDNMTNYDLLLIDYIFSTSAQDHATQLISVGILFGTAQSFSLRINAATYNRTGARNFYGMTNANQIHFEGASYNTSSNNGYAIPYRIIGIKLTIPSASGVSF